jgi:murein DD-endopeptidase MepM/ murein hydrolase activator NlpD
MQKVEIIFLPFATKRLPRHFHLSKPTLVLIFLSLLFVFIMSASFVISGVTNLYHQWQLTSLNHDHQDLVETLVSVKQQAISYNQLLAEKDKEMETISLITETETPENYFPMMLTQSVSPADEQGFASKEVLLEQLLKDNLIEEDAFGKINSVNQALSHIENRIQYHWNWAEKCHEDIQAKYYAWAHIPSVFPYDGPITCGYGARRSPFGGPRIESHRGIDIAGPIGMPLKATADGVVLLAGVVAGYGNLVIINHENGFYSYYGHCSLLKVVEGQSVKRYQTIALLGTSGRSTGPHIHYEIRYGDSAIDPMQLIEEEGVPD